MDVAPTILEAFGLPVPADMRGTPIQTAVASVSARR
jgi:arylsulfatase A-like enzyme